MDAKNKIRDYLLKDCGTDLVGFADPEAVNGEGFRPCGEILPNAASVIVFAKKMADGAVQAAFRMHEDGNGFAAASYATYACEMTPNMELFFAAFNTSKLIEKEFGVVAMPIPCNPLQNMTSTNKPLPAFAGPTRRYEIVDLRRAVLASGLGTVGWSGWPLTPQYGPRQMFGILLTQLKLEPDPPYSGPTLCDPAGCGVCAAVCPVKAVPAPGEKSVTLRAGEVSCTFSDVNKNACAVASLAFRKEFSGRYDVPDQITNDDPTDEELAKAYAEKPISHCALDHYPKYFCNKCLLYCPAGDWDERFARKGLTSFDRKAVKK